MHDSDSPVPDRRVALAPDLREMPDRSARAWTERMAVQHVAGSQYAVESESGATYLVDPVAGTCDCPDATIRGEACKHLRRVAIEITTHRVPPPGKRRAHCGACGRETFVPESMEPPLCDDCALEPGDVVRDRETGDRLVVRAVTSERADEVEIATAETTVADYPTNEGYPPDDVVVEVSYLSDVTAREEPRIYSFPHSRLERSEDAALVE